MYYRSETSPTYRTAASPMYPADMSAMNEGQLPERGPVERAMWARVSDGDGNGREKVPWGRELWDRIDRAVHDEMCRVGIGRQFLPLVPIEVTAGTIPADRVIETRGAESGRTVLSVNEVDTADVFEIFVEFTLTKQQVAAEETLQTAVTLGTRAANLLIQGEDLLLFQGASVLKEDVFADGKVQSRSGTRLDGLANIDPAINPPLLRFEVPFARDDIYGENTFNKVAEAYSELQRLGHYGPYALVLPTKAYADAFAPLANTLILTADRLLPLVEGRLYGTGTVPENPEKVDVGLLLSLGGNTLDLAFGKAATTDFSQEDQGLFRFRVYERFALRDKDRTGRAALLFQRVREEKPPGSEDRP